MDWEELLGKNIDYSNSIITPNIFCPRDYKNINGWKQKIESVNRKFNLNLKILKIKVRVHIEECGLHHQKIIGSRNTDQLYYDDYYCKIKKGCYLETKDVVTDILFIVNENVTEDSIKNSINPGWFSFI